MALRDFWLGCGRIGIASLALAACVPSQRPDAGFAVKTCDGAPSGGSLPHNACLVFDGAESHSFSGTASFAWSAERRTGVDSQGAPQYAALPDFAARAGTAATTAGQTFFADLLDASSTIRVTLTVSDSKGLRRSSTRELVLTNSRPIVTAGATFLRPRSVDFFFMPFAVAHLPVTDAENDHLNLLVTQLEPAPGLYAT